MCPTREISGFTNLRASQQTLQVATGIVMRWDRVDAVSARCAIQRMAIHKHKTLEEIATSIICFAALRRRASAAEGA